MMRADLNVILICGGRVAEPSIDFCKRSRRQRTETLESCASKAH